MFGLLKYVRCSGTQEEREEYKRYYCGVCKTLGRIYGHPTRLLLNRDLVFVSEVIAELGQENPLKNDTETSSFQVRNCFRLPASPEAIPRSMQIAAAYNVLLTRYKLDDNVADASWGSSLYWKLIRFAFSRAFGKASAQMTTWNYPLDQVDWWMQEQRRREKNPLSTETAEQVLQYFAEPSAVTTGLSMKYAAIIGGKTDEAERMYQVGYGFGQLIYLLDALEDYAEDYKKGDFNALKSAYHLSDEQIPPQIRDQVSEIIHRLAEKMQQHVAALSLSEPKASSFAQRVTHNVSRKLGEPVCIASRMKCDVTERRLPKMTFKEKWCYTIELSQRLAFAGKQMHLLAQSKAYLLFGVFLTTLFLMPQKALGAFVHSLNMPENGLISAPTCLSTLLVSTWMNVLLSAVFRKKRRRRREDYDNDCCGCCEMYLCCECADCDCDCCECAEPGYNVCDACACDCTDFACCDCD